MQITQSFEVPYPPDQVWRCFDDIGAIVPCLPGAALTAPPVDGALALTMTVKLGPMVASFAGQGTMTLDRATRTGSLTGTGNDRRSASRVRGEATFTVHDAAAGSRVDIAVDYSITGSLAQFSREGIVKALAQQLTAAFGANLQQLLAADQAARSSAGAAAADGPDAAPGDDPGAADAPGAMPRHAPQPLDLGRLFWPMLLARIRRWLGLAPRA